MGIKRHKPKGIITKLRQVEVQMLSDLRQKSYLRSQLITALCNRKFTPNRRSLWTPITSNKFALSDMS